jgi:hypothetical protein
MKKILLGCSVFCFLNSAFSQVALDSMMTACYPFTGNAQDMSGNNHHGTVFGATLCPDRFGNLNSAYHFNGVNNYIEVQRFDSLVPTDEVSLSFWCKVNVFASHAQFQTQPDDAADRFNISVHYSHNGAPSTFWDYGSIFTTGRFDTINIPFITQWEHYVFTSSTSQNKMAEYRDGVLLKAEAWSDVIVNRNKPLWIGSGSTLACVDGEIDDIRFYNRILSDTEIVVLYNMIDMCSLAPPVAGFAAADTMICETECNTFNNLSVNATSYQWNFFGGTPPSSTDSVPFVCYNTAGTYDVSLIATNSSGSDTITFSNYITVISQPVAPIITQSGDTLFSTQGYIGYQWYFGSSVIAGATDYFYVATQSGNYNLVVTGENGCQVGGGVLNVIAAAPPDLPEGEEFGVYPNPAKNYFGLWIRLGRRFTQSR